MIAARRTEQCRRGALQAAAACVLCHRGETFLERVVPPMVAYEREARAMLLERSRLIVEDKVFRSIGTLTINGGGTVALGGTADNTNLRVVEAYGSFLSRHGTKDESLEIYQAFEKALPRHPLIVDAMANVKAGKTLPPLADTPQAGGAEVLYGLGTALGRRGGEDLGLVYLQLALYLAPNQPLALLALAEKRKASGRQVLADCRSALEEFIDGRLASLTKAQRNTLDASLQLVRQALTSDD